MVRFLIRFLLKVSLLVFCTTIFMNDLCNGYSCSFTIVVIAAYNSTSAADQHIVGPAVDLAIAKIRRHVLPECDIQVVMPKRPFQKNCDMIEGNIVDYASKVYYAKLSSDHPVSVFIGTTCTFANKQLLDPLLYWNLLLMDGSSVATFLADKQRYPNFLGFSYTHYRAGEFIYQVVKRFKWAKIAVIYDIEDAIWRAMFSAMDYFKTKPDIYVEIVPCYLSSRGTSDVTRAVLESHRRARVVIVFGNPQTIRNIMLAASKHGYTDGDHVYLAIAYFKSRYYFGTPVWSLGTDDDTEARKAFQSLFLIRQKVPSSPEFQEFDRLVQASALGEYNQSITPFDEVNIHAMGFHDAIITYGTVASEVIADGENIFDGRQMLRRFTNRTFMGIRGPLPLDNLNNLNGHFELWNFRFVSGNFVKVIDFPENFPTIQSVLNIEWASSEGPPPNEPICGFEGTNIACHVKESSLVVISVTVVLVTLIAAIVLTVALYRHHENSNNGLWWKINSNDLTDQKKYSTALAAIFRDQKVHLTQILSKTITQKSLIELHKLRNTKNEKLIQILGICIGTDSHVLVTEYCSRGPLYELVRSSDTLLVDWNFRLSILRDVVEGLFFIHRSWIFCHGRLKSSCCYLNSRLSLKISEYALRDLVVPNSEIFSARSMWTAPEMLDAVAPTNLMRRQADIYSFAIILSEVCLLWDIIVFETVADSSSDYVKKGGRPNLESMSDQPHHQLAALAELSWSEDPKCRPSAHEIQTKFEKIAGNGLSIVDDLLMRMAHHAEELEQSVNERTTALLEEKLQIQELLFEILPRTVALDLIAGIPVLPEFCDSATVLFSAIQGFSEMAADCTPWDLIKVIHNLYTMIDKGIEQFDVYKVETVNDAYMIASGIPIRNGLKHASEIAKCALYLRENAKLLKMPNKMGSGTFLIGFHTGPLMAGVVGKKMPRFCLFGDAVNTASRMESNSEGGKIQFTEDSMMLLKENPAQFFCEPRRNEIFVKGKGNMRTYWLLSVKNRVIPS